MDLLHQLLGLGMQPKDLGYFQISLRAVVVFIGALATIRSAPKRFLSRMSALDVVLGMMLASMLARGINGSSPLFPTLVGGFVLALLYRILVWLTFRSEALGRWIKGEANLLIDHGAVSTQALRSNCLSDKDLLEELRQEGQVSSPAQVQQAYLERSGKVSVIPSKNKG